MLRNFKYAVVSVIVCGIILIECVKSKNITVNKTLEVDKFKHNMANKLTLQETNKESHHETVTIATRYKNKTFISKNINLHKYKVFHNSKITSTSTATPSIQKTPSQNMITPQTVQKWAAEISEKLYEKERLIVRRDTLLKGFSNVKFGTRNGFTIVDRAAKAFDELLQKRIQAAEKIMRKAEELAEDNLEVPVGYTYSDSVDLNLIKPTLPKADDLEIQMTCRSLDKIDVQRSSHFDANISLESSSVYVTQEVFPCDERVNKSMYWSEGLLPSFRENYAEDASMSYQYFCSAKGFLRHYPAAVWDSMYKLKLPVEDNPFADVYDCRLRSWYVSASGAPRDILILIDSSGSMNTSSNTITAEKFTLTLLSALTDDDQVNVLPFNVRIRSAIDCLSDKLVPANHVNSAAMMTAMKEYNYKNETKMDVVLEGAVRILQSQKDIPGRPESCQQAIILLTDELYANYTDFLRHLDPEGNIRLFVLWMHDINGLRDNTASLAEWAACSRDGHYLKLATSKDDPSHADVTEKVLDILQVLQRPLVQQRRERLRVFSDVYAHVEDPRRSEEFWHLKENTEQGNRYQELKKDKEKLLSSSRLLEDFMHQKNLDEFGHYYEGIDTNFRLQISVSVPVFDYTTVENITIKLFEGIVTPIYRITYINVPSTVSKLQQMNKNTLYTYVYAFLKQLQPKSIFSKEKQRDATRTYPVNRLLGVAGIDIPLDDLKLILPYSELGAGGYLFIVDHRGNIIIHDNLKPIFDGNILKPGYRTVDFLDLEQHADSYHTHPRDYPHEWLAFRKMLLIDQVRGTKTMYSKNIFENWMRVLRETQDYYWRRVHDHYTVVVVLPKYNRFHAVPEQTWTQKSAEDAYKALVGTVFSVHPDWLYCRHVEPYFDRRQAEVLHFIRRRRDESNFPMKNLKHFFSPLPPTIFEKTYQCDERLMARLCVEAAATEQWAREHEDHEPDEDCVTCELGSMTTFFTSESGLTRWQMYHATTSHAAPPDGGWWSRGPGEAWYTRAAAAPEVLVVHAPVAAAAAMRVTRDRPTPLGTRHKWLTAARALTVPQSGGGAGMVGVAGYHFYPQHFEDLLKSITDFPCVEGEECSPTCDDDSWVCVVVDDEGWVVAGGGGADAAGGETEVRQHLATLHPPAMAALLNHSIFKFHWLHDYQGVCFPPVDEKPSRASPLLPSLIRSVWKTANLLANAVVTILCLIGKAKSETAKEIEKRRRHLFLTNAREKFEQLYDDRVLVNRTRIQACDRSRPLYEFQKTQAALELLTRPVQPCSWPLVGAVVPKTNLILLAIYNLCPHRGRPVPNPMNNEQDKKRKKLLITKYFILVAIFCGIIIKMSDDISKLQYSSSRAACWRNRVPLTARKPNIKCFPHVYAQEEGYRQCGKWIADEDKIENQKRKNHAYRITSHSTLLILVFVNYIVYYVGRVCVSII